MKWFYNLKTSAKLISAFVIMAILLSLVGIFGINNMAKLKTDIEFMYNERLIPSNDIASAQVLYQRMRVNIRDMNFIATTPEQKHQFEQTINELRSEIEAKIDKYENTLIIKEEEVILKKFDTAWQDYNRWMDHAIESANKGDVAEYKRIAPEFKKSGDYAEGLLLELITLNTELAKTSNDDADKLYNSSRTITITIIIIAVIFSIGFGYFISQVIARPLNRVVELVRKVASGDLKDTTDINSKDEVGQLAASTNEMVLSLRKTVGGILESAESVSAAAQQISASTEEIASGSSNQADAAQTISELFTELSVAINSVAGNAEEAAELSSNTLRLAEEGGKVIRSSIEGMNHVNQQMTLLEEDSNKIGEIIEVINDIAGQTNLLALNAAIEAARAGDQGRGFAVVADEVRKLAERSSEATKEITSIIKGMQENTQHSVKAVGEGVISSRQTGEAFENIINMVNQSATKVAEIAAASEQQAAQTSEVMGSIESISAATEESAASSEETAGTAQSLANLAIELNSSVEIFKVN
ncbi:methyl-accepting chemotaxis protein [Peribacillus saganii]|uniref:Methyl-accepting chemotaxis protein n=1 Tax=Peribacillus saganii TaxID=2303992 RepID=A0A372LRE7_9BACI|nr:methyl-accepting chemotaxis protein [Peribacillus saganii]RFU70793.1 methyl-accepting chemotaxis protein [Peribacillus saganii]